MRTRSIIAAFKQKEPEDARNDVIDDGLAGYAAVDAAGQLATTWALLKAEK